MSYELRDLVAAIPITPLSKEAGWTSGVKTVLDALVQHVNYEENDERVWPTLRTLQTITGLSERKIRYCLRWLESHRWVGIEYRYNSSSIYTVHTHTLQAAYAKACAAIAARETAGKQVQNISGGVNRAGGAQDADKQVNTVASQPSREDLVQTIEGKGLVEPVEANQPVVPAMPNQPVEANQLVEPLHSVTVAADMPAVLVVPAMPAELVLPNGQDCAARADGSQADPPIARRADFCAGRPAPAGLAKRPGPDPNDRYRILLDRNRYAGMLPQRPDRESHDSGPPK